ncbi:MAG: hypothetical protein M1812_007822 [Candelaria pacifica]|nr:MAG: hypothetical protein M1812_007822 [Candelaria pacifica]
MPCISRMPSMPSFSSIHPPLAEARFWVPIWALTIAASSLNTCCVIPYCIALISTRISSTPPSLYSSVKLALVFIASILLWIPSILTSGLGAWALYSLSNKNDIIILKGLAAGLVVITAVNIGYAFAATGNLWKGLRTCQRLGKMDKERLERLDVYRDEKVEILEQTV